MSLAILLGPGRFVAESLLDAQVLLTSAAEDDVTPGSRPLFEPAAATAPIDPQAEA